ncbi:MAG: thymidylate kinase [Clostridia bacterium]|nr:thymidylate kinase [Clostridia bacterium]
MAENKKGGLIVIEGIDGSGKTTQYNRLMATLSASGIGCVGTSFPNYESVSGALVKEYLGGTFGTDPDSVNAFAASSFFAVDRFASFKTDEWGKVWRDGGLVVSARYTTSNAIHQASKLSPDRQKEFFAWLEDYEYRLLKLPRPDKVFFLDLPVEIAIDHILSREEETGVPRDIHEKDFTYLRACALAASAAADFYGWTRVKVAEDGKMLSPDEIERSLVSQTMELDLIKERRY